MRRTASPRTIVTTVLLAAVAAGATLAQTAERALELRLSHARVVTEIVDGRGVEHLEPADAAKPGDILEYRVLATNHASAPLGGVTVDLPIPATTAYLDASAASSAAATLQATLDRKTFRAPPLKRVVKRDGRDVEEVVRANEYTGLRWVLSAPIAPGQTLEFRARVKMK